MNMKSSQVLRRVLTLLTPHCGWLVLAFSSAIASVCLTLLAPLLIGRGVDLLLGPGEVVFQGLLPILAALALTTLLAALFQWTMTLCTNKVAYRTVGELRTRLFSKLQQVPLSAIDGTPHGEYISRMVGDVEQLSDGLLQGFAQLFTGVITILGTLGFMFTRDMRITLLVVFLTPLSLFVASFIARRSYDLFRRQSAARGELGGFVEELLANQKVVKGFCHEAASQEEFEAINQRLYDSGVDSQFYSSLANPSTRFVNGLVYAAVGIAGALSVMGGRISVGDLSVFLTYANHYTKPFNEISGVVTELQSAFASAARVFAVLDLPEEPEDAPQARVLQRCAGAVSFEEVSFSYDPARPLMENLTLRAQPGQRIAIVGPTGCGKTTLINLLMRFYDVDSRVLRVDGEDVRGTTRGSLRAQYGMVLQESWMFAGTIRDNIAYGRPTATLEEIVAAAKAAHAHGFIKRLPQGYDTWVPPDGGTMSQGQKQLLCIARVMLVDPPILILDEATSSIDTRTEVKIQDAFRRMMEGRTSFIVAHRLSTVREADSILVMRAGRIVEQGTHPELLAMGGFYASLYNSQFVGQSPDSPLSPP